MTSRRSSSLFLVIIMLYKIFLDPVTALSHLPKKKVLLINDDEMLSSARTYNLEDFFWTGSGDGPVPPQEKSNHPTIIRTTTVLATVFLDSASMTTDISRSDEDCLTECPISPASGEIDPSKVGTGSDEDNGSGSVLPDPRYWLLTVLRAPASPLPPALSRSLARLYQRAFLRQQEQHLGIVPSASASQRKKHQVDLKSINSTDSVQNRSIVNNNLLNNTRSLKNEDENLNSSSINVFNDETKLTSGEESDLLNILMKNSDVENIEEDFEILSQFDNLTVPNVRIKRSPKSITQELNIILMRNYSYEHFKNYSDTLDIVKRQIYGGVGQPTVEVFLHNLTRESRAGDNDELTVVYWVSLGGKPVPARTAARDMRLLADSEVVAELGYPVTTKAEPYLKTPEPLNGVIHASNIRDAWLIIGGAILAAIILLSLIALLACRLVTRRKSSGTSRVLQSTKTSIDDKHIHYPADSTKGKENLAYLKEEKDKTLISVVTTGGKKTDERYVTHGEGYKRGTNYKPDRVSSASSSSSSSASDLSQMTATLRQRQRLFEQQIQNEYATVNKKNKSKHRRIRSKKVGIAEESLILGGSEDIRKEQLNKFVHSSPSSHSTSSCDSVVLRRPQGIISPTSYLSMPSVKSFPRGNAVEPLSRVLEPLSVRHLDMDSDSPVHSRKTKKMNISEDTVQDRTQLRLPNDDEKPRASTSLIRLGSMDKDPGVVGPVVWDLHRQRLEKDSQGSDGMDNMGGTNISKMRQRFSELVDDAFSLFGSGSSSPKSNNNQLQSKASNKAVSKPESSIIQPEVFENNRRHSAKDSALSNLQDSDKRSERPHTALPPRPPLPRQNINPTAAWSSNTNTPMVRATSAGGIRRPVIEVELINPDSVSPSNDPAVPLIQAIKKELDRLPGTSDA